MSRKLRHSSCAQARMPVGTPPHFERIMKSLAPLQCLLPVLPTCATPVHVSHTRKISTMISRRPGFYVDYHSINEHLTRTVRAATGSLKAGLWSWQNLPRRLCSLPQTIDLRSHLCISYTVSTRFIITMNSANIHVLCHRG